MGKTCGYIDFPNFCHLGHPKKDICPKTNNEPSTDFEKFLALSHFSPATATLKALSTKPVISSLASALVNRMLLARNATSVLASTMDSLLKDAR